MKTYMDFAGSLKKRHKKDMVILILSLLLSVLFCIYQFYLKHFGLALFFSFVAFVNTTLFTIYCSVYYKTQKLFKEAEKMADEIVRELETQGKI